MCMRFFFKNKCSIKYENFEEVILFCLFDYVPVVLLLFKLGVQLLNKNNLCNIFLLISDFADLKMHSF